MISSILFMRKMRHKEVQQLARDHTTQLVSEEAEVNSKQSVHEDWGLPHCIYCLFQGPEVQVQVKVSSTQVNSRHSINSSTHPCPP